MMYALFIVVIIIAYLMFKAKSQRNQWIEKFATLPIYLDTTILELKRAYPNNIVKKQTSEDVVIVCKGPSHNWIMFFNWIPDGLAVRLEYSDMLGRKITKSFNFNPEGFNVNVLSEIMMEIISEQ